MEFNFKTVIRFFGNQTKTAQALNVSQSTVSRLLRNSKITPMYAMKIEVATRGKMCCEEMCPDTDWSVLRKK